MRKGAIAAVAILVLLAAVVIAVPRLVSLDSARPRLVSAIEEKTGRKASVGSLSLSLFPSVALRLDNLSVSGDPGREADPLLTVARGEVRLALLPLLSGKVVLSRIILDRPSIVFRRYLDGSHSLTETVRRLSAEAEGGVTGEKGKERKSSFDLAVRSLTVKGASLSVRTEGEEGKETRLDLSPVDIAVAGLGLPEGSFSASVVLSGEVRGGLSAEGTFRLLPAGDGAPAATVFSGGGKAFGHDFNFEGKRERPVEGVPEHEISLSFPVVRMERLLDPIAKPSAALLSFRPEGRGSLSVRLSGMPESLRFEVDGDLTEAAWTVRGVRKAVGEPCTVVAQGRRYPERIVLSNGEVRFPPLVVVANGSLSPASGGREWAFHGRLDDLSALSRSRGEGLSRYSPAGRLMVQGKGRRFAREEREEFTVDADLVDVSFRLPDRPVELRDLAGHVTLLPDAIHFQPLGGLLNGQRFRMAGQVGLKGGARGDLELRMAYLDLDALLASAGGGNAEASGKGSAAGGGAVKEEGKEAPWSVTARVDIDSGRARGVEFTELAGTVRGSPGYYEFDGMGMKAFGGSVSASGWSRPGASPSFRANVSMRDVSADRLLAWKTSLSGYVDGRANLSADLTGGDDLAATLAGKGRLSLTGAKVSGFDLVRSAAGAAGLPPLAGASAAAVRETPLSDLSADFNVSDGRVRTENLSLRSGKSAFRGAGSIGLDRTVDVSGLLRLPPGAAAKSAGKFLLTAGGFLELPVRIKGPLASPSVSVNMAEVAVGTAGRAVRGLVDSLPGMGAPKEPPAGETGKVLKGLFDLLLPKR